LEFGWAWRCIALELTVVAIVNLMLVLCVRVPGTQCPFQALVV